MRRSRFSFFQRHRFGHDFLDKAASLAKVSELPPLGGDYTPLHRAARYMQDAFRLSESNAYRIMPSADMFSQSASYFNKLSAEYLAVPSSLSSIESSDKTSKTDTPKLPIKNTKSLTNTDNNPLLTLPPDQEQRLKIGLRLYLAGQYFQSLHTLVKQQPDMLAKIDANLHITRLIDAAVLGSSSERAEGMFV